MQIDTPLGMSPFVATLANLCFTVPKNVSRTAHVVLPVDLIADIDKLVGKRGRSAFLTDVARDEVRRRQQLDALRPATGAWKVVDHLELKS